jgi:hypothetical protein
MSAAANARDREHKERVRAAAPKLLEACVEAQWEIGEALRAQTTPQVGLICAFRRLRAAIAATQPPPNPRRRR